MNEDRSELEFYERKTYLDKPSISKIKKDKLKSYDDPSKDNAFIVEEYDLLLQYVAGTEPIKILKEKMDIKNDIVRLTQLYLDANTKLKLSMPSKNVENPFYEKTVYNISQPQPQVQQIPAEKKINVSNQMLGPFLGDSTTSQNLKASK